MRLLKSEVILLAATFAIGMLQSQFVGRWQTRISRVTDKSASTVNLVEQQQGLCGTVLLVNPDASEIELPIVNVKVTDNVIEFETRDKGGTFYWSLTMQKRDQALLHGSCRETLIDEHVRR